MSVACFLLLIILAVPITGSAPPQVAGDGLKLQNNVKVPVSDGIRLAADIFQRMRDIDMAVYFPRHGYAVSLVDSRTP